MKMLIKKYRKITVSQILLLIFLLMIIFNCRGFRYLLPVNFQKIYTYSYFLCTITSIFTIVFYMTTGKKNGYYVSIWFIYLIFLILFFFLPQYIFTTITYKQGIRDYYSAISHYLYILWIFPLFLIIKNFGQEKLLYFITKIVFIGCLLAIINVFLQNKIGISLYKVKEWSFRNGRIRITDFSSFYPLALFYLWNKIIFKNKKQIKNIVTLLIIFICSIYVESTRLSIMAQFVSMTIMFLMVKSQPFSKYLKWFTIVVVSFVTIFGGGFDALLSQFSLSNNGVSTSYRLEEIFFYFSKFLNNKLFGIGLIPDNKIYSIFDISAKGNMNYTDIGIIGLLGTIGMGSIFIYLIPLIRWGIITYRISKNKEYHYESILLLGLWLYIFMTSLTLILVNYHRMPLFPFCFVVFEWNYYRYKHTKVKNEILNINYEEG